MNEKIEETKERVEKIRRILGMLSPKHLGELYSIIDYLIAENERLEKELATTKQEIAILNQSDFDSTQSHHRI